MKLETTVDLIEAMRERGGYLSDNQLAKAEEFPQATLSSWRTNRMYPTEVHALKIGRILKIDPLMVLAIAAADRTRERPSESAQWLKIARRLARAA